MSRPSVQAMRVAVEARRAILQHVAGWLAADPENERAWQRVVEERRLLLQAKVRLRAAVRDAKNAK